MTRDDMVDLDFEAIRHNVSDRYIRIANERHLRPDTKSAIEEYLSIAVADSDEPLSIQERMILAAQVVSEQYKRPTRDRAIKTGRAVVTFARRETGRILLTEETRV